MNRILALSVLTATLTLATADANAWTRNGTVTGPNGTAHVQAWGSCANGSCSRTITRTGPYGYSVTRQGTIACDRAAGSCNYNSQTTGPRGYTVYRQGTITR